ncbi:transcription factor bHLH118-like [Primulina tabacum]|uniref:transcription factor bHLH118-like n=1 Tax=Primulina tabacum TaxID=48773 RepID=UPI003F593BA3
MFDLRSGNELSFVVDSISQQEDKLSFDDLISDQAFLECNINPTTATAKSTSSTTIAARKQSFIEFGDQESKAEKNNELNIRKNEPRRDLERRRRHEMANLYASLRTILPFECIKGKRSISDHMHEAENFIKQKKKNIQDLKLRRDQLKAELSDLSENVKHSVMVNAETRGVEILISACLKNHRFRISTVFVELMERELNVVAWVTTKTNGKFFHRIHAESSHAACIDPSVLQERLVHVINN